MLARKIALTIIVVAFLPYALTFFIFYSSYNQPLRVQVISAVSEVVEEHKRTIDDYLARWVATSRTPPTC